MPIGEFDNRVAHVADDWFHGEGETLVPDGKVVLVDQLPPHDVAKDIDKDTKPLVMVLDPDQKLVTPKGETFFTREPKLVVELMYQPVGNVAGVGGGQPPAGQQPGHYIAANAPWVGGGGQAPAQAPPPVPAAPPPPPPPHVPPPQPANARLTDRTKYIIAGIGGLIIAAATIFGSLAGTIWAPSNKKGQPEASDPPAQPLPDPPTTLDFDVPTANQSVPFTSVQLLDNTGAAVASPYHDSVNKCTWTVLSNNHVTFGLDAGVTLPTAGGSITVQFVLVDNQGNQSTAGTLTVNYAATTPPTAAAVSPVTATDRTSTVTVPVLAANLAANPGFTGTIQLIDPTSNKPIGPGMVLDNHSPSYGTWNVDNANTVTFAPTTANLPAKNASVTVSYVVVVITLQSSNMPSLVINFPDVVVPTGPSAAFVKSDTTTLGNWIGVYGKDGYMLAGDSTKNPSYVTPAVTSQGATSPYVYTSGMPLPSANPLQKASGTGTVAAAWFADANSPMPGVIVIDLPFTDTLVHQITMYFDDYDGTLRQERIDVVDTTGKVLNTQSLPIAPATNFTSGVYLVWNVSGHVQIRITDTAASAINSVASAVFFDPAAAHATTVLSPPPKPNDYPISNGSRDYATTFDIPGQNPGLLMAKDLLQLVSGSGPVQMLSTPDGDWEVQLDNTIKFIPTIPCKPDNVVQQCVVVRAGQHSSPANLTLTFTRAPEAYPSAASSSQRNVQFAADISMTSLTPDGFASIQLYKDATTTSPAGLNLAVTGGSFQIASSSATVITCEVTDATLTQIRGYYAVTDKNGVQSNRATVTANVVSPMARHFLLAQGVDAGKTLAVNVLADSLSEWGTDPASVALVAPVNVGLKPTGTAFFLRDDKRALQVRGEGTWLVDDTGLITFTAEPSFKGAPTPISVQFSDKLGNRSNPALVLFHPKLADIAPSVQKLAEQSDDDFWATFKTEIANEIAKGVDLYWPNELVAIAQTFVIAFRPLVPERTCPISEADYQTAYAQWIAAGQPTDSTLFDACIQLSWNATKRDPNPLVTRYWALSSIVWMLDESL